MSRPEGDPECPRRHGEPFLEYLRRLALFRGYKVQDAPQRRAMPTPATHEPYVPSAASDERLDLLRRQRDELVAEEAKAAEAGVPLPSMPVKPMPRPPA